MFMSKLETQTFQDLLAFTLSSDYIVNLPERELSTMSNFLYNFVVLWFSHLFWWPISSLRNSVTIMARNYEITFGGFRDPLPLFVIRYYHFKYHHQRSMVGWVKHCNHWRKKQPSCCFESHYNVKSHTI